MENLRQKIMIGVCAVWCIFTGAVFAYMVYTISELYIFGQIISRETFFLFAGTVFFILLLFTGKKKVSFVRHIIAGIVLVIWLLLAVPYCKGSVEMDIKNNSGSYKTTFEAYKDKEVLLSEVDSMFDFSNIHVYSKNGPFVKELGQKISDTHFREHKLIRKGKFSYSYDDFYQELILTLDYGGWDEDSFPSPTEEPEKLEKKFKLS